MFEEGKFKIIQSTLSPAAPFRSVTTSRSTATATNITSSPLSSKASINKMIQKMKASKTTLSEVTIQFTSDKC